jgi:hypothetical protein
MANDRYIETEGYFGVHGGVKIRGKKDFYVENFFSVRIAVPRVPKSWRRDRGKIILMVKKSYLCPP